jgi:hypothetical protein
MRVLSADGHFQRPSMSEHIYGCEAVRDNKGRMQGKVQWKYDQQVSFDYVLH